MNLRLEIEKLQKEKDDLWKVVETLTNKIIEIEENLETMRLPKFVKVCPPKPKNFIDVNKIDYEDFI